jgi:Ni/Fe-hydrogenase subunit HybB-like protein
VVTYLWTKGVAAGALLIAALALLLDVDLGALGRVVAPGLALAGTAATGALLVLDLKRPERFLYIFTKPNPRSWLVLGSVALVVFGVVSTAWLTAGVAQQTGHLHAARVFDALAVIGIPSALAAAGYTAFLFGQAEGRDLWQSRRLLWHLIVQAVMVGAGALAVAAPAMDLDGAAKRLVLRTLIAATVAHVLTLLTEYGGRHASRQAAAAAHLITHGPYARLFWTTAVGLAVLAVALAAPAWNGHALALGGCAGIAVQIALLAYESVFIRAGQDVPLS